MNSTFRSLCLLALFLTSQSLGYGAFVDEEVEDAVDNGETEIPVILTLKSSPEFSVLLDGDLTREERIRTLQKQSAEAFHSFAARGRFTRSDFRQFWIVNGLSLTATANEVRSFAQNPEVDAITYDRAVDLGPERPVDGTPRGEWTYGLQKIGIPMLRQEFGLDGSGVVVGIMHPAPILVSLQTQNL